MNDASDSLVELVSVPWRMGGNGANFDEQSGEIEAAGTGRGGQREW